MRSFIIAVVAVAALACASAGDAQPTAVHKTTLLDAPFPAPPLHTVTVRTLVDAGGEVQPHTHPGVEMAYIVSGEALVTMKGKAPQHLAAGGSFSAPPDTVHSVRNAGAGVLTILSTYVVDKTRPIASPAP